MVVGSDVTLARLSETLARYRVTRGSEIVLFGTDGYALAYPDTGKLLQATDANGLRIARLSGLGSPVLTFLDKDLKPEPRSLKFEFDNRRWEGAIRKITRDGIPDIYVLMASPLDELLAGAFAIRKQSLLTIRGSPSRLSCRLSERRMTLVAPVGPTRFGVADCGGGAVSVVAGNNRDGGRHPDAE